MSEVVNAATVDRVEGSPPPYNSSDYQRYDAAGNKTLAFEMQIHLKNGSVVSCDPEDTAILYPVTPYTLWMIRNYLTKTLGKKLSEDESFPGDPGLGPEAPSILRPFVGGGKSVARFTSCDRGWAIFRGLPPGTYVAFAEIGIDRHRGGSPGTHTVLGATFNPYTGLLEPSYHQEFNYRSTYDSAEGNFVMVSEQYTFLGSKPEVAVDRKFYVFGEVF